MKIRNLLFFAIAVLTLVAVKGDPKNPLRELFEKPKDFYKMVQFRSSDKFIYKQQQKKGFAKKEDFKKPKDIGLVCFMVKDQQVTDVSSMGSVSTITTTKGTNDKVKAITQLLYEQSIDELKSSFDDLGYNLLEPAEFCDTEEKMNTYHTYEIEYNVAEKMASEAYLMNTKNGFWAVPSGYRPVPLGGMTGAGYMKASVKNRPYHYMQQLGVDALMFIYIQEASATGKLSLVSTDIHVKTPGYNEDGKTGFTDYAIKFNVSFNAKNGMGDIFTYKMEEGKKGKMKKTNEITGLDPIFKDIVVRMSQETVKQMDKWFDELK